MSRLSTGTAAVGYFAERSRFGSSGSAAPAETFPQNSVLDAFTRANEGPPMTGWADNDAGLRVISNQASGSDAFAISRYATGTWADAEAFATIAVKPSTDGHQMGVLARLSTTGIYNGYGFFAGNKTGTDTLALWKVVASAYTKISSDVTQEFTAGDKIGIKCVGSTISGWYYNGSSWSKVVELTDSSVTAAGYIGLGGDSTVYRFDDFGGGAAS